MKLYHGNIYNYFNSKTGTNEICIYMCDTNLKHKVCIIPLYDSGRFQNSYPIKGLKKEAYPNLWKEIDRGYIKGPLRIKVDIAKVDFSEYVTLSDIVLDALADKLLQTFKSYSYKRVISKTKKYALTEDFYKYVTWFEHKTNLEFGKNIKTQPGFVKHGLYYVEIGENVGTELRKLRPAVIFKKCQSKKEPNDSSYIVLPISSKQSCANYKFNVPITVNGQTNYIKINDIRRVSIKRIVCPLIDKNTKKPIILTADEQSRLNKEFEDYFLK